MQTLHSGKTTPLQVLTDDTSVRLIDTVSVNYDNINNKNNDNDNNNNINDDNDRNDNDKNNNDINNDNNNNSYNNSNNSNNNNKINQTFNSNSNSNSNGMIIIAVEDEGIGISEDSVEHLFQPFKQVQRLAGGTGLGLYSLSNRIRALKGTRGIRARYDGKQGSVFWFGLPYRPDLKFNMDTSSDSSSLSSPLIRSMKYNFDIKYDPERKYSYSSPPILMKDIDGFIPNTNIDINTNTNSNTNGNANTISNNDLHTTTNANNDLHTNTNANNDIHTITNIDTTTYNDNTNANNNNANANINSYDANNEANTITNINTISNMNITPITIINQNISFLIVDDSPSILKVMTRCLERKKFLVDTADNGSIGLNKMIKGYYDKDYDVVLMDLQMPVMDGIEAVTRYRKFEAAEKLKIMEINDDIQIIKSMNDDINKVKYEHEIENENENEKNSLTIKKFPGDSFIIGISANSDEDTKQCALNAGMNTFMSKPFSLNELLPTLHRFGIFS